MTGKELLDAQAQANDVDHAAMPVLYTFFDFNGVRSVDISTPELRLSARIAIKAHGDGSKRRVVAIYAKDDLAFALARMWQVFVQQTGWETKVFRERSEAVAWISERVAAKFRVEIALD
jgi:hypothetical protein